MYLDVGGRLRLHPTAMDPRRPPGAGAGSGGDGDGDGSGGDGDPPPPPPMMYLRLPATLLASLADDSRISIRRGDAEVGTNGGDGGKRNGAAAPTGPSSLTVARGSAGERDVESYPLKAIEPSPPRVEYYSSFGAPDAPAAGRKLRRIGAASEQYAVESAVESKRESKHESKSAANLKEIGKRTRRLLEEERRKRKEIVRLDDDAGLPRPKPKGGAGAKEEGEKEAVAGAPDQRLGEAVKPPLKQAGAKAKGKAGPKPGGRKRKRRVVPPDVDGWSPDVEPLLLRAIEKDDRSNVVRLHGLPLNATPEKVRKFFHGLNPSSIFALPSSRGAFEGEIEGWDARYDAREGKVERHRANFRVYARFASAPVADAAMERSGEYVDVDRGEDKEGRKTKGDKKYTGAAISLSPVPKHVASFLMKNLAVRAAKGETMADTVTRVERRLGATATEMAWQMASKQLRLKGQILSRRRRNGLGRLADDYVVPTDECGYQSLAKVYNRMIDLHEALEVELGLLLTHAFDPSCSEDPAHMIAQAVFDWLLDESYVVKRLLTESRLMMEP